MSDRDPPSSRPSRVRTLGLMAVTLTVVALFVGTGVLTGLTSRQGGSALVASSGHPSAWSGATTQPSTVKGLSPAASAYLASFARESFTERTLSYAAILSSSPAQVQGDLAAKGYHVDGASVLAWFENHPSIVAHPADLSGFVNSLIGAGIGCAVGGFVGSFVPVVGTAAGCAIGAIATLLGIAYLTSSAGGLGIAHEDGIVRGQAQVFLNAQNASTAFLKNTLSSFNATESAWEATADSVAVNQLPNSTFNYTLDIAQSGIGAVFDSLVSPFVAQASLDLANLDVIMYQIYSTPGLTNVHDYISFTSSGACLGVCASHLTWYGGFGAFSQVASGSPTFIEILPFGSVGITCGSGSGTLINVLTNKTVATATSSVPYSTSNFSTVSGGFYFYGSAGTNCNLQGSGVLTLASSPSSGAASTAIIVAGCHKNSVPASCNVVNTTDIVSGQTAETIQAVNASASALMPVGHFLGGVFYAYLAEENAIVQSSMTNAYTYWFYLRTLGYTSYSLIPSGCLIPPPNLAVPSYNLANTANTLNYTEAAYASELNALGTFYNVGPNTTNFCHGHPKFVLGNGAAPPYGENITGFVLTLPVGAHQSWKAPHTWAVNGSNPGITTQYTLVGSTNATPIGLTLWPSVITYGYAIPLNTVVQIPVNDPMSVDILQTLTYLTLYGNGSAITSTTSSHNVLSGTPATSTAGAEIYLTQCIINKIAENPCVINGTSYSNATGTQSGGGVGPITFPSGGTCGQTGIVGSIVNGVAGFVGNFLGLGCDIGWLVLFIVGLVVVIAVVYVVAAVVRRD